MLEANASSRAPRARSKPRSAKPSGSLVASALKDAISQTLEPLGRVRARILW